MDRTFCFIDVETTGGIPSQDRVIEVGIIKTSGLLVIDRFQTLIDPGIPLPYQITEITGIKDNDLIGAPKFSEVEDKILSLIEGSIFVAHNAQFDYSFLKHEFRRLGKKMEMPSLCTVKLARRLYPSLERHNLDSIISFLQVEVANRHRALDDAKVLHTFFEHIHSNFKENELADVFKKLIKEVNIKSLGNASISSKKLPEGPGVYVFYGDKREALFVGKSMDVKARVISHFTNEFESARDLVLIPNVKHIEGYPCCGALGTSILYREFIKTLSPRFNGGLKSKNNFFAALKVEGDNNSLTKIQKKEVSKLLTSDFPNLIGIYRSRAIAISELESLLHAKNICTAPLSNDLTKCSFPTDCNYCCQKDALHSNFNLMSILPHSPIPKWPFNGPIAVIEEYDDMMRGIVLNNWCLLGVTQDPSDVLPMINKGEPLIFDWLTYLDIKRFLKNRSNWHKIKEIKISDPKRESEEF